MTRKPRIHYEGALYHVITRGNNRKYIFKEEKETEEYLIGGISISLLANIIISKYIITDMKLIINPYVIIGGLYPAVKASNCTP